MVLRPVGLAAGAAFTIPAFVILGYWDFGTQNLWREYVLASSLREPRILGRRSPDVCRSV